MRYYYQRVCGSIRGSQDMIHEGVNEAVDTGPTMRVQDTARSRVCLLFWLSLVATSSAANNEVIVFPFVVKVKPNDGVCTLVVVAVYVLVARLRSKPRIALQESRLTLLTYYPHTTLTPHTHLALPFIPSCSAFSHHNHSHTRVSMK